MQDHVDDAGAVATPDSSLSLTLLPNLQAISRTSDAGPLASTLTSVDHLERAVLMDQYKYYERLEAAITETLDCTNQLLLFAHLTTNVISRVVTDGTAIQRQTVLEASGVLQYLDEIDHEINLQLLLCTNSAYRDVHETLRAIKEISRTSPHQQLSDHDDQQIADHDRNQHADHTDKDSSGVSKDAPQTATQVGESLQVWSMRADECLAVGRATQVRLGEIAARKVDDVLAHLNEFSLQDDDNDEDGHDDEEEFDPPETSQRIARLQQYLLEYGVTWARQVEHMLATHYLLRS